eukprot:403356429
MEVDQSSLKYIPNNLDIDSITHERFDASIRQHLIQLLIDLEKNQPHHTMKTVNSLGKIKRDLSVYTGSPGQLYMYYRLILFAKRTKQVDLANMLLSKAMELYEIMKPEIEKKEENQKIDRPNPAFYMGTSGYRLIGTLLHKELGVEDESNKVEISNCLDQIMKLEYLYAKQTDELEDEILYGTAGYLYCLLQLKVHFSEYQPEKVDHIIKQTVMSLIEAGQQGGQDHLIFTFPRGGTPYLGAAHGTIGILYMLLKAIQLVPSLQQESQLVSHIKKSLDYLIILQTPEGHFNYADKRKELDSENDYPVHFCHEAQKTFQNPEYYKIVEKLGECVWKYGLLRKGHGLCHGICGNSYFLMSIYKLTNDDKWRRRAEAFVMTTYDDEKIKFIENYENSLFKVQGMPDHPYSLMEGNGGVISCLADFAGWDENTQYFEIDIKFPGYEI